MKEIMRGIEIGLGILFLIAAVMFYNNGDDIWVRTSMHETVQWLQYVCSVLCAGFGCLMIKR